MASAGQPVPGRTATGTSAVLRIMNRELTIMRGTEDNDAGDESDVGIPLYTGVQAAIAEDSHLTFDAAASTQRTVRTITCRMNGSQDVLLTDTLFDPASGLYYLIESMASEPTIGYYPPFKILTLRMRSGVSVSSD